MEGIVSAAVFGIISSVTLIGNTLVVVLFIKRRQWLNKAHACLLLALAVQDILTAGSLFVLPGFVLPADVYDLPVNPKLGQLFCTIVWSWYAPFALSIVSIYTCLMLAVDRFLAVWKPLSYKRLCSSGKVIAVMVILPWIAGFLFEIGTALNARSSKKDNGTYVCEWVEVERSPKTIIVSLLLLFGKGLVPALLMAIVYGRMMIALKQSSSRVSQSTNGSNNPEGRDETKSYLALKRITRMACAASALVVICWLPDQIYYCLFEIKFIEMNNSIHNGLHILAFLNTCFNPFLYSFSNRQYRAEFKMILCCLYHRNTGAKSEVSCTDRNRREMDNI